MHRHTEADRHKYRCTEADKIIYRRTETDRCIWRVYRQIYIYRRTDRQTDVHIDVQRQTDVGLHIDVQRKTDVYAEVTDRQSFLYAPQHRPCSWQRAVNQRRADVALSPGSAALPWRRLQASEQLVDQLEWAHWPTDGQEGWPQIHEGG